jgi:hypothetical protein
MNTGFPRLSKITRNLHYQQFSADNFIWWKELEETMTILQKVYRQKEKEAKRLLKNKERKAASTKMIPWLLSLLQMVPWRKLSIISQKLLQSYYFSS